MTVNISDWSEDPAGNTTVDGVNIGEGAPAANMNNAMRSIMVGVKSFYVNAPNTAAYVLKAAATFNTVTPKFDGRGGFVHFNDPGLASGRIFVQPLGGAAPAMSNGDILFEF